jgi:glycosyltransferase involved in cell wall biosynthesis
VDDGSTDGTTEKLRDLCERAGRDNVVLIHHDQNAGYGAALKTGIMNASTEHIVITDADNSYPNERIPEFYEIYTREGLDMVVGARTTKGAAIPMIRRPPKWCLNKLANYLTRTKIPDLNSGLRIFRRDVILEHINLICDGFSFTTTLTLIMLCNSYKVKYIPIAYYTRSGKSKIHPIKDTLNFVYLICSTVMYFRPLRVFMPPGVLFLLLSMGIAIYQAVTIANITTVTLLLFQTGLYLVTLALLADLVSKSRPVKHTHHIRDNNTIM